MFALWLILSCLATSNEIMFVVGLTQSVHSGTFCNDYAIWIVISRRVHPSVTNDHTFEVSTRVIYGGYCSTRSRLTSCISTIAMGVADITLCFLTFFCKLIFGSLLSYNALGMFFFSNKYFILSVTEIFVLWWSYQHHIRVYIAYIFTFWYFLYFSSSCYLLLFQKLKEYEAPTLIEVWASYSLGCWYKNNKQSTFFKYLDIGIWNQLKPAITRISLDMTKLSIKSARIVSRIQLILLFEIYMSFTTTKYMVGISKPACIQTCCNLQNQSNTDIYSIMCHIAKNKAI